MKFLEKKAKALSEEHDDINLALEQAKAEGIGDSSPTVRRWKDRLKEIEAEDREILKKQAALENLTRNRRKDIAKFARNASSLPSPMPARYLKRGLDARRQAAEGRNPPSWVVDEAKWEKAKRIVAEKMPDCDEPYACITYMYENIGGVIGNSKQVRKRASNQKGRTDMVEQLKPERRQEIIENLLTCNDCGWSEEDRETLNAMKDERLAAMDETRQSLTARNEQLKAVEEKIKEMEPVVNAVWKAAGARKLTVNEMPAFIKEKMKGKDECDEGDEDCIEKNRKGKAVKNEINLTEEQVLNALTPEMREDLAFARHEKARQKRELVERLLVNVADNTQRTAQREKLLKYDLDALRSVIQPLVPEPPQRVADYAGTAAPVGNTSRREVPPMPLPQEYAEAP